MSWLLGTIKTAKEIGIKGVPSQKYIWAACEDCRKERWVVLLVSKNQPKSPRCRQCAWRIIGKKQTKEQYGSDNPFWKGGQFKDKQGYVMMRCPNHPYFSRYKGYVNRSRLVLEAKLGRYLLEGCEPHHINEIKDDDRPENLIELTKEEHRRLHAKKDRRAEHMMKFRHLK